LGLSQRDGLPPFFFLTGEPTVNRAPESFVEKLEREFRGRLRIRWSREANAWHIEQKVKRGLFPGTKPSKKGWDETTDAYIRGRDGYIHVLSVTTGDRMPCRRCRAELKVPYNETHFITCQRCKRAGIESHYSVGFFPLGDMLIDALRKLDPENPHSERLAAELDAQNEALAKRMEHDAVQNSIAAFNDDYRRIIGIPTGYLSGRTHMWKDK
jgi:hypothetical protein